MRLISNSRTGLLLLTVVLQDFGQGDAQSNAASKEIMSLSASCFSNHTSGSGATYMRVCFSNHGNLASLEAPSGVSFLSGREGYAACAIDAAGNLYRAYDAGPWESNWGSPVITQPNGPNTFPLMITRRTTNNWMELKQAFSRDTSTYEVIITMTLKNTSGRQLFINLDRYADWDVPGYYGDDYTRTSDLAVQAWNLSGEHASISLSTSATDYPTALHGRYSDWYSRDLAYCGAGVSSSETGPDDFVGRVNHYFEIPPGASKTVRVYYRRQ